MPKFTLSAGEMTDVLDDKYANAYDNLWGTLEGKILEVLSEKRWLEIWHSGDYKIEMSITFNEIEELRDDYKGYK
jgi:hypothetical protein